MLSGQIATFKYDIEYRGSTQNVIKNVLLKKADAGVTLNMELNKEAPQVLSQIRTILQTQEISSHPLSAHPRVAAVVRAAVQKAVLALNATPTDAKLLREVWLASPLVADYAKDYRELEGVDVNKFSNWGK